MHIYSEQHFSIPNLNGFSEKQIVEHLNLYTGYVKHVNLLRELIHELVEKDKEKYAYVVSELRRRFGFEFNGMRMHEYYFEEFEGGFNEQRNDTPLTRTLSEKYGGIEQWNEHFRDVGMTRGVGWAVLYFDTRVSTPHVAWIEDHELGTLTGLPILLAMDMWEHAYMVDYTPSEKKKYIDAFFNNLNWSIIEKRFEKIKEGIN